MNSCVSCGKEIPEGVMVCHECDNIQSKPLKCKCGSWCFEIEKIIYKSTYNKNYKKYIYKCSHCGKYLLEEVE